MTKVCQFCNGPVFARGMCSTHYKRWYRHGDPRTPVRRRGPSIDLSDVEILAMTGETLPQSAARLGVQPGSLAKYLHANKRPDLLRQFAARGPLEPGQYRRHSTRAVDEPGRLSARHATLSRKDTDASRPLTALERHMSGASPTGKDTD